MPYVNVPNDLSKIKTKMAFNLTKRQFVCFGSAGAVGDVYKRQGLGVWGVVNLLEGYGSDNPGSKSQGMKQLMAGGGIIVIGTRCV